MAWLGAKMLHRAVTRRPTTTSAPDVVYGNRTLLQGFISASLNPQSLVYFTAAIVSGFHDLRLGLSIILILIVLTVTLVWYEVITRRLDNVPARDAFKRARPVIETVFGVMLLAGAVKLALPLLAR